MTVETTPPAPETPSALHGVVVLGTDTGAGKTTFSTALLRLARRNGLEPFPHKPVETDWNETTSDAVALLRAAGRPELDLSDVCPIRLPLPVAPAVAAAAVGRRIDRAEVVATARRLATRENFLLVETAGGLLSPYGPRFTGLDLAEELALPIALVARNGLGTINHTCLAIGELRRRHLAPAILVLVDTAATATPDRPHNARLIEEQTGIAPLLTLPFVEGLDPDRLADALEAQIPPGDLFARLGIRLPRPFAG
jgi:dethiobiotin synthetase